MEDVNLKYIYKRVAHDFLRTRSKQAKKMEAKRAFIGITMNKQQTCNVRLCQDQDKEGDILSHQITTTNEIQDISAF